MTIKTNLSRRTFLTASTVAAGTGLAAFLSLAFAQSSAANANAPLYGPPPGVAKLNANENPYDPAPKPSRQ